MQLTKSLSLAHSSSDRRCFCSEAMIAARQRKILRIFKVHSNSNDEIGSLEHIDFKAAVDAPTHPTFAVLFCSLAYWICDFNH